jgi:hypothetical protein
MIDLMISTRLDPREFDKVNHEDLINFICEIDLYQQDAYFTEELLVRLARSLREDLDEGDYLNIVNKITSELIGE